MTPSKYKIKGELEVLWEPRGEEKLIQYGGKFQPFLVYFGHIWERQGL